MADKKKIRINTLLVISTLVVILALAMGSAFSLFSIPSDFSVLSIGEAQFLSNDPNLDGKQAWLVTVVAGTGAQSLKGGIDAADLTDDDKSSESNFLLEFKNIEEWYQWPMTTGAQPIYNINLYEVDASEDCSGVDIAVRNLQTGGRKVCVHKTIVGRMGGVGATGLSRFSLDVSATGGGGIATGTLTDETQSVTLMDGNVKRAHIQWQGNLGRGIIPPSINPTVHNTIERGNDKFIGSRERFNDWWTFESGTIEITGVGEKLQECIEDNIGILGSSIDECEIDYNSAAEAAITPAPVPGYSTTDETGGLVWRIDSTGVASDSPLNRDALFAPLMSMRIDADWLGIYVAKSEPKIESVSAEFDLTAGKTLVVTSTIKNVGDTDGNINVFLTCPLPLGTTNGDQYQFAAGQSREISISVTSSAITEEVTKECTLTAQDLEDTTRRDIKQISITIKPGECESDKDGDGVFDCYDSCPDEAETFNDYQDVDGCPDEKPIGNTGGNPPALTLGGGFWDGIKGFFQNMFGGTNAFWTGIWGNIVGIVAAIGSVFILLLLLWLGTKIAFAFRGRR